MSNEAVVTCMATHKHAPTLSAGSVTPEIIASWQRAAESFFRKSKIVEAEKVSSVFDSFADGRILNWLESNRAEFLAPTYMFSSFMKDFRKRFLDADWERNIIRGVITSKMQETESFEDWSERVMKGNNLLAGTTFCFDDKQIRTQLENNLSIALARTFDLLTEVERVRIEGIEELDLWMKEMRRIDRNVQRPSVKRPASFSLPEVEAKRHRPSLAPAEAYMASVHYHNAGPLTDSKGPNSVPQ
jgi:hypothetical protein